MYIYQAALVIRTGFVFFFIFLFTAGFSQQNSDSIALLKNSETLLAKKINFSWKGGSLPKLLDQLGTEQGLKVAYSDYEIRNISISANTFTMVPVSEVLESVLLDSEFNYILIGRTVAIVRDPSKKNSPTNAMRKSTPRVSQGNESHIYPSSSLVKRLPPEEAKLLRKIYGKELRLNAKHPSEPAEMGKDTSTSKKRTYTTIPLIKGKSWYVRANLGLNNYFLRYRSVSSLNWKEDLNFKGKPKRSIFAEAEVGIFYKTFLLATGIGIHKLSLEYTHIDHKALPDIKEKSTAENYSVLSIPLHVLMYKHKRNIYVAGGGGLRLNFIKRISGKGSLKEYYDHNSKPDKFSEKPFATAYGISLRGEAGFKASENILLCGGLESIFNISPYFENSLYKFYPHSLSFKISIIYFFH